MRPTIAVAADTACTPLQALAAKWWSHLGRILAAAKTGPRDGETREQFHRRLRKSAVERSRRRRLKNGDNRCACMYVDGRANKPDPKCRRCDGTGDMRHGSGGDVA